MGIKEAVQRREKGKKREVRHSLSPSERGTECKSRQTKPPQKPELEYRERTVVKTLVDISESGKPGERRPQPRNEQGQFTPRRDNDRPRQQTSSNSGSQPDRRMTRSMSNPERQGQSGNWRNREEASPLPRTFMGKRLKEGAPPPPPFVPKDVFATMSREDRDRVLKNRDEYSQKWSV